MFHVSGDRCRDTPDFPKWWGYCDAGFGLVNKYLYLVLLSFGALWQRSKRYRYRQRLTTPTGLRLWI
jgi:hypothetical protein